MAAGTIIELRTSAQNSIRTNADWSNMRRGALTHRMAGAARESVRAAPAPASAKLDRHEDPCVVALHEQCHMVLRARDELAQVGDAVDFVAVGRQHDVTGP